MDNGQGGAEVQSADELIDELRSLETDRKQPEVITLTRIRAGEQPFACWSFSDLKVTRDGKEFIMRVPIKSVGIAELMERIAKKAPNPPRRIEVTSKDSPAGQALGLKRDRVVEVEDHLNPDYVKQMSDYNVKASYSMILHALAVDLEDARGAVIVQANDNHSKTVVTDEDSAIEVLKQAGLTDSHIRQLSDDVRAMSSREKEVTGRE